MIAFQGAMQSFVPHDGAERAHHDAGPARDALFRIDPDVSRIFVFGHSAGDAGLDTGRVLTMPALQGKGPGAVGAPLFVDQLDTDPRFGGHRFMPGVQGSLGLGMLDGARQLAGSASEAFFYAANDVFHGRFRWCGHDPGKS
jgi:hypothetical protein